MKDYHIFTIGWKTFRLSSKVSGWPDPTPDAANNVGVDIYFIHTQTDVKSSQDIIYYIHIFIGKLYPE